MAFKLKANLPAKKRKVKVPTRAKIGLDGAPRKDFGKCKHYFHYEVDAKDCSATVKRYIKRNWSKEDQKLIFTHPEWNFKMFGFRACVAWWLMEELPVDETIERYKKDLHEYFDNLRDNPREVEEEEDDKPVVVRKTPQELMKAKIHATILTDLDDWFERKYVEGEKDAEIDVFSLMTQHQLKTNVPTQHVHEWCDLEIGDLENPKECGLDHLTKREINARIKTLRAIKEDADRFTLSLKATRKTRVKKPKAAEKQVSKLKFMKMFSDLKLTSIDPSRIPNSLRLYTYNTKTKELTEYVSTRREGFEVSGTTIKGYDLEGSRRVKLRKPDEFLSIVLKKTPNQIDKAWEQLTTKTYEGPNGRVGPDTILLRVLDK